MAGALAQAGDLEGLRGALAAAEKIGDERYKAQALSGVAGALAQAGDLGRSAGGGGEDWG